MLKYYLLICIIALSSCAYFSSDVENYWEPDVYAGSPEKDSIIRKSGGDEREIRCQSAEFKNYLCLHKDELTRLFEVEIKK